MPEFKIFKIIFKCLNYKCRQAFPIRKYFYKASRELAVQIPRLLLRHKTKSLEEEQKNSFSSCILFGEVLNLRFEVKL